MNLHLLQTHESRAEAIELMSVQNNIVTPQSNKPIMGVVQDTLVSSWLMSSKDVFMDKELFFQCIQWVKDFNIPKPAIIHPVELWTGLQCLSILLPDNLEWGRPNINNDLPYIQKGEAHFGRFNKRVLGRSHGSLVHILFNDFGPERTLQFLNEIQKVNHEWFRTQGFTCGIKDMLVDKQTDQKIKQACNNVDNIVEDLIQKHGENAEIYINRALNQTRDSMGKLARDSITNKNHLLSMITSGSKGSNVNMLQICACLGQQNVKGQRIQPSISGRTLPMFEKGDNRPITRGFVKNSYIDGLTPADYFFHTAGGREGLIDTAGNFF